MGLPRRLQYKIAFFDRAVASPSKVLGIDEKIKMLEKDLAAKQAGKMKSTYQQSFATAKTAELFFSKTYNKTRSKELKPIDRRPKKEVRPDYSQ